MQNFTFSFAEFKKKKIGLKSAMHFKGNPTIEKSISETVHLNLIGALELLKRTVEKKWGHLIHGYGVSMFEGCEGGKNLPQAEQFKGGNRRLKGSSKSEFKSEGSGGISKIVTRRQSQVIYQNIS